MLAFALLILIALPVQAEDFLVGLRLPLGLEAAALEVAQAAVAQEVEALGGEMEYRYKLIPVVLVDLPPEAAAQLLEKPGVSYVEPDGEVAIPEPEAAEPERIELSFEWLPWGVERIGADRVHHPPHPPRTAWLMTAFGFLSFSLVSLRRRGRVLLPLLLAVLLSLSTLALTGCGLIYIRVHPATVGFMGEGVKIALLDSGIDMDHFDLKKNYRGGYDFVNEDPDPRDDNGHGTEVAGVLAARENGFGLIGVAPRAELWAVKVLDATAHGAISDLVRGLEWAVEHGMEIVNMSLGVTEDYKTLREAVRAAWEAGLLLVAPSGNDSGKVLYPAAYPEVIAVTATDEDDNLAWFSNTGPEVELAAPGVEIPTTSLGGRYILATGTSFAAPHVAGVAALLISAGVEGNEALRARLDNTAQDLGLEVTAQGYGLVDAVRAVFGH